MLRLSFLTLMFHYFSCLYFSIADDTISPSQFLSVNNTLVSSGNSFELGFFPKHSNSKYLGIWYKDFPDIVVWVANREKPLLGSHGGLTILQNGSLVILDINNITVWTSNSSAKNPIAQLLDSGNFAVRDKAIEGLEFFAWQSFDFPSDTLLEGMKIGWDLRTGLNRFLTSWRDSTDPSKGNFTYRIDLIGLPQLVLRHGFDKKFRTGPWNGLRMSGVYAPPNPFVNTSYAFDSRNLYLTYQTVDESVITRFKIDEKGSLQMMVLSKGSKDWSVMYTLPNDVCDNYGTCGPNGVCSVGRSLKCECLKGFVPKAMKEWELLNWTQGCVRKTSLSCGETVGFARLDDLKVPDNLDFRLDKEMRIEDCKAECSKNCSCVAYASSDISNGENGCMMWFGELVDIRELFEGQSKQYVYLKMLKTDLESTGKSGPSKRAVLIIVMLIVSMAIFGLGLCFIIWRNRGKRSGLRATEEELELPFFDFLTISNATNNFSFSNKLGEGGFGQVYKGNLLMQQEVAVKRLSNNSGQGLDEFKNELTMIAKLQHRNLVKLLGYCVEGEEKILIYEYMPNKSLDGFIFDENRKAELDWQKRFEIIAGIARGLLYLHQDSRVRIVHRDLKTSNILLDSELNPKISDFGIARIFGGNQVEAKTKRVIGTYGYMPPEYAIDGNFSTKSDVFSFGVVLLEILCGQKNRGFHHSDHHYTLLGHAWMLWKENKALELIDQCLKSSYIESEVLRCIQVGLLCVQKLPDNRPSMASVVLMLRTEGPGLPLPTQPGFFTERSSTDSNATTARQGFDTGNHLTMTVVEAR